MGLVQGPAASSPVVGGPGVRTDVQVVGLLVSPVHRYDGRPGGVVPPQDGRTVAEHATPGAAHGRRPL